MVLMQFLILNKIQFWNQQNYLHRRNLDGAGTWKGLAFPKMYLCYHLSNKQVENEKYMYKSLNLND